MTEYRAIRDFIAAKLATVSTLAEVHSEPALNFASYPAAILVPADGSSDYETNAEDERVYAFDVIIYDDTKVQGVAIALDNVMDVASNVLSAFAQDKMFLLPTPVSTSMPAGTQFINCEPVAAGWGGVNNQDKELMAAMVKLRCRVSVTSS